MYDAVFTLYCFGNTNIKFLVRVVETIDLDCVMYTMCRNWQNGLILTIFKGSKFKIHKLCLFLRIQDFCTRQSVDNQPIVSKVKFLILFFLKKQHELYWICNYRLSLLKIMYKKYPSIYMLHPTLLRMCL